MNKKSYVPDISSFFESDRKITMEDVLNSQEIKQEVVSFDKNDICDIKYSNLSKNVYIKSKKKQQKRRYCRYFKRTYS